MNFTTNTTQMDLLHICPLYLHQEDVAPLRGSDEVLHLAGVHGKGLLTQHVLPSLEEEQAHPPVLRVQNPHIHHVCRAGGKGVQRVSGHM